jgi:metal-dependent amidase/aminoacylase/carboxypeptidase family protein
MSAHAAAGNFESTIDHCVELRRKLHAAPESAHDPLGEVLTAATIAGELENFCGIAASAIRKNVGLVGDVRNGVYADIHGTGPAAAAAGGPACVALRSELDGLQMTELNATLPYRSAVAGHAHMCGHDGHMASLVATAALLQVRPLPLPAVS